MDGKIELTSAEHMIRIRHKETMYQLPDLKSAMQKAYELGFEDGADNPIKKCGCN